MYSRLNDFITKHNILCDQQYGFRNNRTTSLALMEFVEEITTAIEKKICNRNIPRSKKHLTPLNAFF